MAAFEEIVREGSAAPHYYAVLLGLRPADLPQLLEKVRRGFPYSVLEHFLQNTAFPLGEVSGLLGIPQRTLTRRKAEGRFSQEESDRLLRSARLFARTLELFEGDVEAARDWLSRPSEALGGLTPIELAPTDLGTREVEALVDRLEQGVF